MALTKVTPGMVDATGTPSSTTFLRGDGTWAAAGGFDVGTAMLFVQTSAPTGWTKSTTHNDKALRIVSGTASSGGSVAFTTAFTSGLSAGATTLSTAQMPAHTHPSGLLSPVCSGNPPSAYTNGSGSITTGSTGGGGSHTHTLPSFAVSYVDVIIATKD